MNKLVNLVLSMVLALLFEAVLRRFDAAQADVQEAKFLDGTVAFVQAVLDEIPNVPFALKLALVQPALIKPVAKFCDDLAEKAVNQLIDDVTAPAPAAPEAPAA